MDISLSENSKAAINIAYAIAKDYQHVELAPAHLLKALLHEDAGLHLMLENLHKDINDMEDWAEVRMEIISRSASISSYVTGNATMTGIFNEADSIRMTLLNDTVEPAHALAALCTPGVGFTYEQLKYLPLKREEIISFLTREKDVKPLLVNSIANSANMIDQLCRGKESIKYFIDKTMLAKDGKLDAIVGREKEIRMMAEILCRRSKPNVLIVGDPGVGKSALVDGFAHAVIQNNVPRYLINARIFELDISALITGASYKGEIEERFKSVLKEIKQFERSILFIDELHILLEKSEAFGNAASLLKSELAKGEIITIGTTTLDKYRRHIEKDDSFNRQFEMLQIDEPDAVTCFKMIRSIMPSYEKHHGILIPDSAIYETIRLAKRYIKDCKLPDAAIDLADRSMAALRMINDVGSKEIAEFKTKYNQWWANIEEKHDLQDWQWFYRQLSQQVSPILWCAIQSEDDPNKMEHICDFKIYLQKVLDILEITASHDRTSLERQDVAAIISFKTGIPVGEIQTQERERLLNMENVLKKRVLSQDHAIKVISDAVLENRTGLGKPDQPIGCFFFLGPTGTGKTELAKSLAEFLFQDEKSMIRFDMSEFKEAHAAAFLLGAPPGFVGYEDGGSLVNKIRQQPYSVVLFDEIEKAHASLFDIFLQIMDEGKLHDKHGKEGDFSNAVIIFTSNIGDQYVTDKFNSNQLPASHKLMELMAQHFRPEFLGRLTDIIPFAPINEQMVTGILAIQLKSLHCALEKRGTQLKLSEAAIKQLSHLGYSPTFGARPLAGIIRSRLRRPLSYKILSGELATGSLVKLHCNEDGEFEWTIEPITI